jgi:hypothetical protein
MGVTIRLVNMVPLSRSSETNDDSETNLSLNPLNKRHVAGTAFTPSGGPNTPVYLSKNGGDTWTLNAIVPGPTGDYNAKFSSRAFYAGNLRPPVPLTLDVLRTKTPFSGLLMTIIDARPGGAWPKFLDQPWVQVWTVRKGSGPAKDHVYVGANDLIIAPAAGASIDICANGTAAAPVFKLVRLDVRPVTNQDGPSVRIGIHRSGKVYAAFFGYRPPGGSTNSDVVVVRDDHWGTGATAFKDLLDPLDLQPGSRVVTGINTGWWVGLGSDRTGSDLTLAVDPVRASIVWVAWCDVQGGAITLHARRSTDSGKTWSGDLLTVPNAKNPALAIGTDHRVGLLYQQVVGTAPNWRWEEHLQLTRRGATWHDILLAKTAVNSWTGDYSYLETRGPDLYGVFAADNTPDHANFPHGVHYQRKANFTTHKLLDVTGTISIPPSIDPFFFKLTGRHKDDEEDDDE